jgi:YcxB-like protein
MLAVWPNDQPATITDSPPKAKLVKIAALDETTHLYFRVLCMNEIEFEFREQDLVHFNELRLAANEDLQKKIRNNRMLVPGVMLVFGLFYYVYYADVRTPAYIALLAMAWAIASPFVMKIDMRRQFFKQYSDAEKKALFGVHQLKIEAEHLFEKNPGGKHRTPWSDILRVERDKQYVYLYVALDAAIVIPRETIKSGDLKAFAKQAEVMIERNG